MQLTASALALAVLLSAPLAAQKMGGSNEDAPIVSQTFTAQGAAEVVIDYTAITWADGHAMSTIQDKKLGARLRKKVNREAPDAPLGALRCDATVNVGGTDVGKGLYALYFTIDDDCKWHLHAQSETDDTVHHEWTLDLVEMKKARKRLSMSLLPGDTAKECEVQIRFGKMEAIVPVKPAAPKKRN